MKPFLITLRAAVALALLFCAGVARADLVRLDQLVLQNGAWTLPYTGGTVGGSSGLLLTSLGRSGSYTIWRVINSSGSDRSVISLRGYGTTFAYNFTAKKKTETYIRSSVSAGAATHNLFLNTTQVDVKAAGNQTWSDSRLVSDGTSSLKSITVSPDVVLGGASATATITLSDVAPAGGALVTLSSSDTGAAKLAASVTIPAGQTQKTVSVTTYAVTSNRTPLLGATWNKVTRSASLVVRRPSLLKSFWLKTYRQVGGEYNVAVVKLLKPAPAGGVSIDFSVNDGTLAASSNCIIPAGETLGYAQFDTYTVGADATFSLTASTDAYDKAAPLSVVLIPSRIQSVSFARPVVLSGDSVQVTITLRATAGASGQTLSLHADDPSVLSVPATVVVPAGQSTFTFTARTARLSQPYTVILSVEQDVESATARLNLVPL